MDFITILVYYVLVAIIWFIGTYGTDYVRFQCTGVTDIKFPINSMDTMKIYAFVSAAWLPFVVFMIYIMISKTLEKVRSCRIAKSN